MLLLISISIGCHPSPESHMTIDIRAGMNQPEQSLQLSQFGKSIQYIPLETDTQYLLQNISKVLLYNQYIFVTDNQKVLQFTQSGSFVRPIGRIGKGPGEYHGPIRFSLDSLNQEIIISSVSQEKVSVYDLNSGQYKSTFDLPLFVSDLAPIPNKGIAYFTRETNQVLGQYTMNEIYLVCPDGNMMDSVANPRRNNIQNFAAGYVNQFAHHGHLYYLYNYRDTLYQINNAFERRPYARFRFANQLNSDLMEFNLVPGQLLHPDHLWISRITGNADYLFIDVNNGFSDGSTPNTTQMVWTKQNQTLSRVNGLTNDLDSGMVFWPKWVQQNTLIGFYHTYEILDFYKSHPQAQTLSPEFLDIAQRIDNNDNPVLILLKR